MARLAGESKGGLSALQAELEGLDRESLFKLFYSKEGISKHDAERMAEAADQAFRSAREREERIEAETRKRVEEARIAAMAQTEAAGTAAAAAAWWVTGISVATAAAAALGGWVGSKP
jgi:hypothetical protein